MVWFCGMNEKAGHGVRRQELKKLKELKACFHQEICLALFSIPCYNPTMFISRRMV